MLFFFLLHCITYHAPNKLDDSHYGIFVLVHLIWEYLFIKGYLIANIHLQECAMRFIEQFFLANFCTFPINRWKFRFDLCSWNPLDANSPRLRIYVLAHDLFIWPCQRIEMCCYRPSELSYTCTLYRYKSLLSFY